MTAPSIPTCSRCATHAWGPGHGGFPPKPVPGADGLTHHPKCIRVLSIEQARAKYGRQKIAVSEDDGLQIMVIRPNDPNFALALARTALDENDGAALDRLPSEVEDAGGQYTFVGWLPETRADVPSGYVVDAGGFISGEIRPGDSLVTRAEKKEPS